MNLRQISNQGSQQITLQWNESEAADHYIIAVSPSVIGPSSSASFVTPNSTVGIPVSYNEEYNISVVASNCAGNSTPAEITILAKCK